MTVKARPIAADDWRILRALSLYRLALVAVLMLLFESGYAPRFFEQVQGPMFQSICLLYVAAALILLGLLKLRQTGVVLQTYLQFGSDLIAVCSLVWASDGVPSGLGMLLITPTVGCSLILSRRMALLLAAGASLSLLAEELARLYKLPISDAAFTETGILGSMFFVTAITANAVAERARRSEALAARVGSDLANLTRLNERIVEQMQDGAIVVDHNQHVRLINAAARRLLDLPAGEPIERLDQAAPRLAEELRRWRHGGQPQTEPFAPSAHAHEVLANFSSLGGQEFSPVLILLDDAREARARGQQLKLAGLGRLSANIAHEIRNPLAAISNAGQLLSEATGRSEEDRRLLDMIHRHSDRINRIVNDVLSLSRRDLATPDLLVLPGWVARAVEQYRESGAHADRAIRLDVATTPFEILFDQNHLQQVLVNLLDNAFQHGGEQVQVTVRCSRLGATRRPCLEILDDGAGIPAALADRVFEPFFTTAHQGTGLGLYLARELCEYNQARLSYIPRAEHGACFRIEFQEVRLTR
jgi:two-component system sensor histidine kinase PilS (NtrC family)